MNWIQIGLWGVYVLALLVSGVAVRQFLFPKGLSGNRMLALGESFLLGAVVIVTEMLLCSLVHQYRAGVLWAVVVANFLFLLWPELRRSIQAQCFKKVRWDASLVIFILFIAFFLFRNCFFLVDVDSHSTYLYTQKLWIIHGTSLFSSPALDMKVFAPQFNAVPYALGLSLFNIETLFPQLVVAFWTVICALLMFGYISWRYNRVYGLAAVFLIMLNDHMFFSGAYAPVVINSCLIGFIFMAAYNFWEARRTQEPARFFLACFALTQFIPNKYQAFHLFWMMFLFGCLILPNPFLMIRKILSSRRWLIVLGFGVLSCSLWFLKNWIATGCPTFPIFAGQMRVLNWHPEMAEVFKKFLPAPLSLSMITKYFSYMFFWPGVAAFNTVIYLILSFPIWGIVWLLRNDKADRQHFLEVFYWFALVIIFIYAITAVSFVDPRHYRYGIALAAVATIIGLHTLCREVLRFPTWLVTSIILVIALQRWPVMIYQGGDFKMPFMQDNVAVLKNKLHMAQIMPYYYPGNYVVFREYGQHSNEVRVSAWDTEVGGVTKLSAFLLPVRPQVGLWYTTAVNWESYPYPQKIVEDLIKQRILYIMTVKDSHLNFEKITDYAVRASQFDRHPKETFYNYNFPPELSEVKY